MRFSCGFTRFPGTKREDEECRRACEENLETFGRADDA